MTISDKDLDIALDSLDAPEPSALLKSRILKAAKAAPSSAQGDSALDSVSPSVSAPAPTSGSRPSFAKRYMAIAASLLAVGVVGMTALQTTAGPDTVVAEMADLQESAVALGFEDIYNWVESEDAEG